MNFDPDDEKAKENPIMCHSMNVIANTMRGNPIIDSADFLGTKPECANLECGQRLAFTKEERTDPMPGTMSQESNVKTRWYMTVSSGWCSISCVTFL